MSSRSAGLKQRATVPLAWVPSGADLPVSLVEPVEQLSQATLKFIPQITGDVEVGFTGDAAVRAVDSQREVRPRVGSFDCASDLLEQVG